MKVIAIIGESSAGKNAIQNILAKDFNFHTMVSVTTRPPRQNEKNSIDYYFIKDSIFDNLIKDNNLIEHREYKTIFNNEEAIWRYGLEKAEIKEDKTNLVIVDNKGLKELKEYFKDNLISIYITAPLEDRKVRAKARDKNFEEAEFNRRALDDAIIFKNAKSEVDLYIHNLDLYECISRVKSFLKEKSIV